MQENNIAFILELTLLKNNEFNTLLGKFDEKDSDKLTWNYSKFIDFGKFILNKNDSDLKDKLIQFIQFLTTTRATKTYLSLVIHGLGNISDPAYDSVRFNIYNIYIKEMISSVSQYLAPDAKLPKMISNGEMPHIIEAHIFSIIKLLRQYKKDTGFYASSRELLCQFLKDVILPSIDRDKIKANFILKNLIEFFGEINHFPTESNNEVTLINNYITRFSEEAGIPLLPQRNLNNSPEIKYILNNPSVFHSPPPNNNNADTPSKKRNSDGDLKNSNSSTDPNKNTDEPDPEKQNKYSLNII